ncbi:MAG TPA: TonB-dependent receptor [Colwellia sp.]|nr:TonB-dependent receptor [Colwellia sp.]
MFSKNITLPYNKVFTACALCLSVSALSYTSTVFSQNISGKIVNHQDKPISGAQVKINGREKTVTTDEQGLFTIENLSSGKVELHTSAKNYAHDNQYIIINQDDISGVEIKLSSSVMEVLDVYATPLHTSTIESALPVNVIAGDDLKLKQASTLGETLKNEVGVHSTFYGSVASSPIIRGLDGPRVLITQNGLDAGDASRVGPDHSVATETSTATQIEVLRGPATLFYGSGAIGGVVNIVDNRVPTSSDTVADWLLQYNDVSNEKQGSFSVQTGNDNIAVHFDAFWRDAGDYVLPKDFDSHAGEEEETQPTHLASSDSQSSGFTLGSSYLFDQGFIGFSYGTMSRDYGIPGHAAHEEESVGIEEGTKAEMEQDRFQLLSEVNFDQGFIKQLASKFAYTDYQHQEVEDGALGTTFKNKSNELKFDIFHQEYKGWQGAWTLHYKHSDFEAIGEEAFSPPSKTDSFAVAWLEEKHFGDVLFQLGARVERVTIDADDTTIGFSDHEIEQVSFSEQSFTPLSTSLGLVWDYQTGYNIGLSLAVSQRAPSAVELFSFGSHIGTGTFEVGSMYNIEDEGGEIHVELSSQDPNVESSYSIDLSWRKFEGDLGFVVNAFYNQINDYYYQQDTGLVFESEHDEHEEEEHEEDGHDDEDGTPILAYLQNDVDMYGVEAEVFYQVSGSLKASVFGDYIKAKLSDGGDLPRIPPMRIGTSLQYQGNNFDGELNVNHYFEQDNIGSLETVTESYSMVDINMNYYFDASGNDLVLYVKGNNLTDDVGKVHSSFLKDISPLPGRNFSVGIRGSF